LTCEALLGVRGRNLEDAIRHARWEAEMVRRLEAEWFEQRDKWLIEAWLADMEMWRDSKIRNALIKAILAKDKYQGKKARRSSG